ncbi:UDP-N-acetylmuramoyl-L-alanyl-D-glutamate--2,6-diaminopimelate ligase [Nocardioides albertanoniae]|uniref:UDP-N-acetylmuramoyl-L-alanyl-D-glutamate--2, 6-diaminopimelate ligase n=1 Tax=Nocardioides albertanoniae TaxID=1175486 RepID=UPI001FE34D71|nr:UDP-N-acetylmuramoyl-L-alanyl-D-glutamate--2,6-diaminopimelate ligase [Nocardioides albertanoniae]
MAAELDLELRGEASVTGVSLSSQRVMPGDLYAALPGSRAHGATYAAGALEAGAVAVLTDAAGAAQLEAQRIEVPTLLADQPRKVLGALSARVYGDPSSRLRLIGVTGTQGKTTTTRLAESALLEAGHAAGVIGTVGTRIGGHDVKTPLTTPEAPDLHGLFARMVEEDTEACAMEVSSHALVMGRVDGVVFDVAVFLNLGRDHLDFHDTVEDYFQAKAALFTPERARMGIVNIDDEHGRRLAEEASIPVVTYALHEESADWHVSGIELRPDGSSFVVHGPDGLELPAASPLAGDYNVSNTLAALASIHHAYAAPGERASTEVVRSAAAALTQGSGVPGRLERVDAGQPFTVVVDYAHKPDAVEAALGTLRPLTESKLIAVIGAGGDRDSGKRPIMGEISARLADHVIVTDDNPRTEDPASIRRQVLEGTTGARAIVEEIGDRRAAIGRAIELAEPGDIVVVAGKGHETGQEIEGVTHPFDDREVAREAIAKQ